MNIIRTSQHIRTHRVIKGFRSCVNATGAPQRLPDYGRVQYQEYCRLNRNQRWLAARTKSAGGLR